MTDKIKTNTCPVDPECEIDEKGYHKKYHLAPAAGSKLIQRPRRCAFCGLDAMKCNDRVTMLNVETGDVLGEGIIVTNGYLPIKREDNART